MTSRRPRYARAAACALAACSVALFALACDAKLPTSEEVNSMDVSAAEGAARRVALLDMGDSASVFTIDGIAATADEAHALAADRIASISVARKVRDGDSKEARGEIHIVTRAAAPVRRRRALTGEAFEGVLLLDGARVPNATLSTISPDQIASVEVLKGDAARATYGRLYPDSAIANGVINITTRSKAGGPR